LDKADIEDGYRAAAAVALRSTQLLPSRASGDCVTRYRTVIFRRRRQSVDGISPHRITGKSEDIAVVKTG